MRINSSAKWIGHVSRWVMERGGNYTGSGVSKKLW